MKTKTKTSDASLKSWTFTQTFAFLFGVRKKEFDDAKAKFVEEAAKNPAHAIGWAQGLMEIQHRYECWMLAVKHLGCVGSTDGLNYRSNREAVEACIESITEDLMSSIGGGQSTSMLSNADHLAKQVGYKIALRDMKGLLSSKVIDA